MTQGQGSKMATAAKVAQVAGAVKGLSPAVVAYETLKPRPTAKGTLSAGGVQGPSMPARLREEAAARKKLAARKASTKSSSATPKTAASFDSAFKDARRAKASTFTWRGKKYTTKKAGE